MIQKLIYYVQVIAVPVLATREGCMRSEPSFGNWLKNRRKALDLTQEDLARRAGCATVTIHKIEADGLRPSRQMAEQLAAALELAPDERARFIRCARGELAVEPITPAPLAPATPPPAALLEGASGLPPKPRLPTGTLTWLLTDIVGSTALWEADPAAMRVALARHDALFERHIA